MNTLFSTSVLVLYFGATLGLMVYGLNCYVMLILFLRRRRKAGAICQDTWRQFEGFLERDRVPVVTTQIAVFNEMNVVERVMRAACAMRYPRSRHEIQVLDDSTDETRELIDRLAVELRTQGHDIQVVRRTSRLGFKAGALEHGLHQARGEFIAVFDADFAPPEDYLVKMIPFFLSDEKLGFVQARWGHLNPSASLLTVVQAIGIDGHFLIEQTARGWNGLFMNFNGTAGVWRRQAIEEGGGWQWDTLTEDLDLSFRVQFAGWKPLYLPDVVVPAELPDNVNALRGQQFRWAKGSFQTIIKLLPPLLRSRASGFKKAQALLHMSGYLVHPLMLILSVLALPILTITVRIKPPSFVLAVLALPLILSVLAPSTLYAAGQFVAYRDGWRRLWWMPMLVVVGVGLAVSNTRAILEALFGRPSEFVRTPKRGDREIKAYRVKLPWVAFLELLLGVYCLYTLSVYVQAGRLLVGPFLAIYAAGFLLIGVLTLLQSLGRVGYGSVRKPSAPATV